MKFYVKMSVWMKASTTIGEESTSRRSHWGPLHCGLVGSQRQEPWRSNPWLLKLGAGTWNVASLVWKEPELVKEAER